MNISLHPELLKSDMFMLMGLSNLTLDDKQKMLKTIQALIFQQLLVSQLPNIKADQITEMLTDTNSEKTKDFAYLPIQVVAIVIDTKRQLIIDFYAENKRRLGQLLVNDPDNKDLQGKHEYWVNLFELATRDAWDEISTLMKSSSVASLNHVIDAPVIERPAHK